MFDNPDNQIQIVKEQQKVQLVQHYLSSLQKPQLTNVEITLEAIRKRNQLLAQLYLRQRQSKSVQEYLKLSAYPPIKEQNQDQKIIESKGMNPWIKEINKQNNKITKAQQDFISQFQKFRKHKRQLQKQKNKLQQSQLKPDFQRYQCTSPNIERKNSQLKIYSHFKVQKQAVKQSKYNQNQHLDQLIKRIFLALDKNKNGVIQKIDIIEYMAIKKQIIEIFGISLDQFKKDILDYQTQNYGVITFNELKKYLKGKNQEKKLSKQEQQHIITQLRQSKHLKQSMYLQLKNKGCLLNSQAIRILQQIYHQIDQFNDHIVSRFQLIKKIREDPRTKNFIDKPAVYQNKINRTLIFSRILKKIQLKGKIGKPQQQKIKEFISFNQFIKNFTSQPIQFEQQYSRSINNIKFLSLINQFQQEHENSIQVIPKVLKILENAYKECKDKIGTYIRVSQFVQNVKLDPDYEQCKGLIVRKRSQKYDLQGQGFRQVLDRMLFQSDAFLDLSQILEFFSKKGRPIQFYQKFLQKKQKQKQDMKQQIKKIQLNKRQADKGSFQAQHPRITKKIDNKNVSFQQSNANKDIVDFQTRTNQDYFKDPNLRQTQISKYYNTSQIEKMRQGKQYSSDDLQKKNKPYMITIPKVFNFMSKYLKPKNYSKSLQRKQQKKQFRARSIPKGILEIGTYQKIIAQQIQRRKQIKKQSMSIALSKQCPFSFYYRQTKKSKSYQKFPGQQYKFKALPVPSFCTKGLYKEELQKNEERRKQIRSRMAQQSLSKSKLPPRMEKDQLNRKAKALREAGDCKINQQQQKIQIKSKKVPNFEKLQKQFDQSLKRGRNSKRPTEPVPFIFHQVNKKQIEDKFIDNFENVKQYEKKKDKLEQVRKRMEQKPKIRAASTKKYEDLIEHSRNQRQQMEQRIRKKKQEDQKALKINQEIKQKLKSRLKFKYKQQDSGAIKFIENNKKAFKQMKKKIDQKLKNQPLLVDRPLKKDLKLQKMKKLVQIKKTFIKNGIRDRKLEIYFTKQQMKLIALFEQMEKLKMVQVQH